MQCLQTSEDISQRKSSSSRWKLGSWPLAGTRCSTNATWRQVLPLSPPVLSCELPVQLRPSSGTSFHSLQATSHALQPMQIEVSVKNPIRGGCSVWPAAAAGSLPPSSTSSPAAGRTARSVMFSIPVSLGDAGAPLVGLDERQALRLRAVGGPGWMSTVSALTSWMCELGSSDIEDSSFIESPRA